MNDIVYAADAAELRQWLHEHHRQTAGVWLEFDKGANRTMSYQQIVRELLCVGWIDSLPRKLSDERSLLYVSPRKPKSKWSGVNKRHVAELTEAGLMQPAGLAMVELAKRTGTWDALNEVEALVIPADLAKALMGYPEAAAHFAAFPASAKRGILEWITSAKREATREERIAKTADCAARNERVLQWGGTATNR